jgi:hypothetical protein
MKINSLLLSLSVSISVAALGASGCGDDAAWCSGGASCISARLTFVGAGNRLDFAHPAHIVSSSDTLSLGGSDLDTGYSVAITWKRESIPQPGEYDANAGDHRIWIGRPHPSEPGKTQLSTTKGGTIRYESVGYDKGAVIMGTFDGVELKRDDPDDTIHITLSEGVFLATVP